MNDGGQVPAARRWSALEGPLRVFAAGVPFLLAVSRASSSGQWRDDLPAVRDLGLVAVGVGGGVSTCLTQALTLIPLGSRTYRASFGSALALGLGAWLLYGLVMRALREHAGSPRLVPVLAAIATLTAALSPTWQREGTIGGGAMLAAALALGALELTLSLLVYDAPGLARGGGARWVGLGALLGALFAESPPAALVAAASCGALVVVHRLRLGDAFARLGARSRRAASSPPRRDRSAKPAPSGLWPTERVLVAAGVAFVAVAVLLLAPLALRPLAPHAWVDVGRALSAVSLSALDVSAAHTSALSAWIQEIGVVSLVIAGCGAIVGLRRRRGRALMAALLVLVAADVLVPASVAGLLSADPLTALRSLAIAAIAVGSALGVRAVVHRLLTSGLPMARAGAVLIVVFHLTLVALTSEEAGFVADRSEQLAAEEWTDQAFGALPPRSAVLARSPALVWRLWAARVTRGERPDVVALPVTLLDRGHVAAGLAKTDRALEPLLRDFALIGEPSEFALSALADVRPLHVEMDARWSKRLIQHLAVDGMWLEYAPQPLGTSDRKLATTATLSPMRRVIAAIRASVTPDAGAAAVLSKTLRDQADVLLLLGENAAAQAFVERMGDLAPTDPLSGAGWLRLAFAGLPTQRPARASRAGNGGERRSK